MARLTKPVLKDSIASSVRGDQHVVEPVKLAVQKALSLGERTYENVFGEIVTLDEVPSVPEISPLQVSQENGKNPFLYYMIDKVSEGVAASFDTWQHLTKIRGKVKDGVIDEDNSGLLYEEVNPQSLLFPEYIKSDFNLRNKLLDTSIPDIVPPLPPGKGSLIGLGLNLISEVGNQVKSLISTVRESAKPILKDPTVTAVIGTLGDFVDSAGNINLTQIAATSVLGPIGGQVAAEVLPEITASDVISTVESVADQEDVELL